MTVGTSAQPPVRFPAPGAPVPGAPPPLHRALTPADGIVTTATQPVHAADETTFGDRDAGDARPVPGNLTAAAAMAGVAVGLEIARCLGRRQRRTRRHRPRH